MATYSQKLAEFVCDLKFKDLPEEILRLARCSTIDSIGVILAGHQTESARIAVDVVRSNGGTPESTIFGYKSKFPAHASAFANAVAAHSTELDDHIAHTRSLNHPGVVTFPAAFAMAEKVGASGEQFMVSVVAGYEINSRLNGAANRGIYDRGFHGTGVCGPFGAAAAAAPLLGLNPEQLANAFGICGSMAAGLSEYHASGAWTKRMHPGWACQGGITAVELARRGYTGPPTILEGNYGLYKAYAGEGNYDLDSLTTNLGRDFEFSFIIYKPFACAGQLHSPLTAAQQLLKEHTIDPSQIEKVTVKTRRELIRRFTLPRENKLHPKTSVDGQFSLLYSLAAFLYFGRAFLEEFGEKGINNPDVLDLAARIDCIEDPEMDKRFPQEEPSEITVQLKDGATYRASVNFAKGSLGNPLTEEELRDKFRILAGNVLSRATVESIIDSVSNLEKLHNIGELTGLITPLQH
ncbi:MAG: MmgE/PrpD family protein [Thermodesulfobacteriota bacterium]